MLSRNIKKIKILKYYYLLQYSHNSIKKGGKQVIIKTFKKGKV